MEQFKFGLLREYWEHKRLLVIAPLILTAIFFLMAMLATFSHNHRDSMIGIDISFDEDPGVELSINPDQDVDQSEQQAESNSDDLSKPENLETQQLDSEQVNSDGDSQEFWFAGVYLGAAWLVAIFYALSSLYSDRRDKSILYWKTMPISELKTVVTKYLFAVVGFSCVALFVAWISGAVLMVYAQLVFPPEMLAQDSGGMRDGKLTIRPVLAILMAVLWCAPFFAILLYASARAKKMPILWVIVPLIVIRIVEQIIFGTSYVYGFIADHSPFSLIGNFADMETSSEFLRYYLIDSFPSLILGLLLAAGLLWAATWHRDHEFEL